eukprot:6193329-Pleurochrysis_carterae.AAC.1
MSSCTYNERARKSPCERGQGARAEANIRARGRQMGGEVPLRVANKRIQRLPSVATLVAGRGCDRERVEKLYRSFSLCHRFHVLPLRRDSCKAARHFSGRRREDSAKQRQKADGRRHRHT